MPVGYTPAETAILNVETEHGITTKGSRGPTVRKSPPLSVQQFRLIANIKAASLVR